MVAVSIANRQGRISVPRALIRRLVRLAGEGVWDKVSVAVVDGKEMADLNRRFTKRDGETDVLAFPLADDHTPEEEVDGEIVVCATRAEREARLRGVEPEEELLLYVAHGAAHLLGYEDHSPAGRRRMYAREAQILEAAGVRNVRRCPRQRRRGSAKEKNEVP